MSDLPDSWPKSTLSKRPPPPKPKPLRPTPGARALFDTVADEARIDASAQIWIGQLRCPMGYYRQQNVFRFLGADGEVGVLSLSAAAWRLEHGEWPEQSIRQVDPAGGWGAENLRRTER